MTTVLDYIIEKLEELGLTDEELEVCKNEIYANYQHSSEINFFSDDCEDYLNEQLEAEFRLVQDYLVTILEESLKE